MPEDASADLPVGSAAQRDGLAARLEASGAVEGVNFTVRGRPVRPASSERYVVGARPDGTVVVSFEERGLRPIAKGASLADVRERFVSEVLRLAAERGRDVVAATPPPGFDGFEHWTTARDDLAAALVTRGCVEEVDFRVSGRPQLHRTTREGVALCPGDRRWEVRRLRDGDVTTVHTGTYDECSQRFADDAVASALARGGRSAWEGGELAGERWTGLCFRGVPERGGGVPSDGHLPAPVLATTRVEDVLELTDVADVHTVCAVLSSSGRLRDDEVVLAPDSRLEVVGRRRLARLPVLLLQQVDPWDPRLPGRQRTKGLLDQLSLRLRRADRAGDLGGGRASGDRYVGPWA